MCLYCEVVSGKVVGSKVARLNALLQDVSVLINLSTRQLVILSTYKLVNLQTYKLVNSLTCDLVN